MREILSVHEHATQNGQVAVASKELQDDKIKQSASNIILQTKEKLLSAATIAKRVHGPPPKGVLSIRSKFQGVGKAELSSLHCEVPLKRGEAR